MINKKAFLAVVFCLLAGSCKGIDQSSPQAVISTGAAFTMISSKSPRAVIDCISKQGTIVFGVGVVNIVRKGPTPGAYNLDVLIARDVIINGKRSPAKRHYAAVFKIVPAGSGSKITAYRTGIAKETLLKGHTKGCAQFAS